MGSRDKGSQHYKLNELEPWDVIDAWGLNFYEGNILKYLCRWRHHTDPIGSLRKLEHYASKLLETAIDERAVRERRAQAGGTGAKGVVEAEETPEESPVGRLEPRFIYLSNANDAAGLPSDCGFPAD